MEYSNKQDKISVYEFKIFLSTFSLEFLILVIGSTIYIHKMGIGKYLDIQDGSTVVGFKQLLNVESLLIIYAKTAERLHYANSF